MPRCWIFRMILIYEGLVILCLYLDLNKVESGEYFGCYTSLLDAWVIAMECNEVAHYFAKCPEVLVWPPLYLVFGWYCTLVKLWAMITLKRADWVVAPPATVVEQVKDVEDTGDCKDRND